MRQVRRPVVRSFEARFEREAAAWVKRGGHAVVFSSDKRAHLYFRLPETEDDLGAWAVYDLEAGWREVTSGVFRGCAVARVPADGVDITRGWVQRDSVHRGPFHTVELECTTCAACCKRNRVELSKKDLKRLEEGGLAHVGKPPYARRRKDGALVLTLLKNGSCKHLKRDRTCGIYQHRPEPCREFPPGSEGCLYAREEEFGIIDGAKHD